MDHYEALGVAPTAPDSVIRAAYKARMREVHPDSGGDPAEAQRVNDAYGILNDPARRAAYDAERRSTSEDIGGPGHRSQSQWRERPAPEPAMSQRPAEPVVYRGDIDPPKRWWASLVPLVTTALTLVAIAALLLAAAGSPTAWAVGGAIAISVSVAVFGGPWKVYVGGFAIAAAAAWFSGATTGYAAAALLCGVGTAVAARWATRREIRGWETYAGDVVLTTVNEQDGVELYLVERAQQHGERTDVLLTHVESGRQQSRSLWGQLNAGTYIALADNADVSLCEASTAGLTRAIALRA